MKSFRQTVARFWLVGSKCAIDRKTGFFIEFENAYYFRIFSEIGISVHHSAKSPHNPHPRKST